MTQATPTHIKLLQKSKVLEVSFSDGKHFVFPCAYLRANSPSAENHLTEDHLAENKGHAKRTISLATTPLITKYSDINIISIEPVGQYAVKLIFDDGHNTGIYSWPVLYELGLHLDKSSDKS